MYTIHDFDFVRNFDDTYLKLLAEAIEVVKKERKEAEIRLRKEWIEEHWLAVMAHPNAAIKFVGNRTIVAIYDRHDGVRVGTAYPINGDVYNCEIGIAVAYAKAMGEPIPACI